MIIDYKNYQIRSCLSHYHIASCGYDLIYGPFKTIEEAKQLIDEITKETIMKFTFDSNYTSIGYLSDYTQEQIRKEPMLRGADINFALKFGSDITREFINLYLFETNDNWIIDSKTVLLMKDWYPCIPGWHHDDIARTREDNQPNYLNLQYKSIHRMAIVGSNSLTDFLVGRIELPEVELNKIIYGEWNKLINEKIKLDNSLKIVKIKNTEVVEFDYQSFHRGCKATERGWRFFIRATKNTNRKFNNEIRNQVQVYLDNPEAGW